MLTYILQGLALGFTAGVTPGPLQTFFFSQTMKNGWRRTLPAAFAPLISDGPIILLVLVILTQTPDSFIRGIQIVGGIFIIYLGIRTLLGLRQTQELALTPDVQDTTLRDATLMNLLNPNPYIFWSTMLGPIFVEGWRESPALGLGLIGGFYLTMILCFIGFIILFGTARQLGPKLSYWLAAVAGVVLLFFGAYQIWDSLTP